MKQFFPILWYFASILVITLVISSLGYRPADAAMIAVMFLPGMLCARYFIPQLSFSDRQKGCFDCFYLILAILTTENLGVMLACAYLNEVCDYTLPPLLLNPAFQLLMLSALIIPEMLLEKRITARHPRDKSIRFTSDRRKISLDPADILYIESNDSEVWIHTHSDDSFRTKTRISQWEAQLDERFLRVHRSYIVNTDRITECHSGQLVIADRTIEISRKYKEKEEVYLRLTPSQAEK